MTQNITSDKHWIDVAASEELEEDDAIKVEAEGKAIAIFLVDNMYYAIDDGCTHEYASLSEGYLEDTVIECPLHQGAFCIKTGKALHAPAEHPVGTYEVEVKEGRIYIRL
jgi:nitrite reductase/ring-hydroxylating ferredoxin subunit